MPAALDGHARMAAVPRIAALLASVACAVGCAPRHYALPMTAAELSGHGDAAALVAYLGQPDASPIVCDARSPGPRFAATDGEARKALARAFLDGRIAPEPWRGCTAAMLRGSDAAAAGALLGDVLDMAVEAVEDRAIESDARAQARLDALLAVYAERDPRQIAPPARATRASSALRRDVREKALGPAARQRATDLVALLELEQGRRNDSPVDDSALDALAGARDERTLRWAASRLPDPALREEARRRVVRLHVAASPLPEVKRDTAAVEDAVLRTGSNAVALDPHPPIRGSLDPVLTPARTVVVEQHVAEQSARLLGSSAGGTTATILPALPLRGALRVVLGGVSTPVTVCAAPEALDVTPCLAPTDVRAVPALAWVDGDGVLHLVDSMPEAGAVALAARGRTLGLSLTVADRRVASLDWPLRFAAPADVVLTGTGPGAPGPDLDVRVDARDPSRLVYTVSDGRRQLQAVVEREDAPGFHVVSRGGRGEAGVSGLPGRDGASGTDGWNASCPFSRASDGSRGGDGSPGGAGGPGGQGGPGGSVRVTLLAPAGAREDLLAALGATVRSEGGAGGPGGRGGAGGRGGRGGSGGSGTTCTDDDGHVRFLSGGLDGASGNDGASGFDGPDGRPGPDGRVIFSSGP